MADASNRRWVRYRMRAVLAVMTVAAVACWLYWYGWPRYLLYRELAEVEASLMRVDGDMEKASDILNEFINEREPRATTNTIPFCMWDDDGGWIAREWPTVTYFLYFPKSGSRHATNAVEIYRLANAPSSYKPMSNQGWSFGPFTTSRRKVQLQYWNDFYIFLRGKRQKKPGMEFELLRVVPSRQRIKLQPND